MSKKKMGLWELVELAISRCSRVLLHGPPGTGKTFCALRHDLGGRNCYSITLTEETPSAEIRGHATVVNGSMGWHDGPAIRAWLEGARLVLNEIDHASADTLSLLYSLLDEPESAVLTLPDGRTVRPAAGFQVICTTNNTPDALPEGLIDRLPATVFVDEVHPGAIAALPDDLRELARKATVHTDKNRRLSMRALRLFSELRDNGVNVAAAARICFSGRGQEVLDALDAASAAAV